MIKYDCPQCKAALEAPEDRIGSIAPCPKCQFQVQVPAKSKSSNLPLILAILGGVCVLGCPIFIVVCLAAIQILGQNANSSFGTVGSSIGSTVSGT